MSSMKPIIGIDLGTTHSLVAVFEDGAPRILKNRLGESLTPSAVSIDEEGVIHVGAVAAARRLTAPAQTAVTFKRDMGTQKQWTLGDREFSPQALSALLLSALKADAEEALGVEIEEAIITVPAYFGEIQRQATRDAGRIAGLKVERIINEPTAAALAYGLHNMNRELKAVVLDIGGGTFDVTVLEIIEGVIEVQSTAGDARLGGEDFTEALAYWIAGRLPATVNVADVRIASRIFHAAERAKQRLTEMESALISLPGLGAGDGDLELTLDRATAEEIWGELLRRLQKPMSRALRDAGLSPRDIDEVLLVGGASRMPVFIRLATQMFGQLPRRELQPDEAIALGAAIQGALKGADATVEDMVVTDVAPFSLGVAIASPFGRFLVSDLFSPIIERGSVIPISRVERYSTSSDFQRQIKIEVYQGEHAHCADNTLLGSYEIQGLPRKRAGEISVDVRFTYDLNGLLEVEMSVDELDRVEHLLIERRPGSMTTEDIEAAREAMKALKFHPRESLPNRTALARADALFTALKGDARAELGQAIGVFMAALKTQDELDISATRRRLNRLVEDLSRY
ncbi:Hsp70 family protein [Myxococcota bacterium]|nr:Hsp70 family protein [Myxococcota bacterium]MBU1896772.1 Hsp70 family protein [Myxococcota bacterium]